MLRATIDVLKRNVRDNLRNGVFDKSLASFRVCHEQSAAADPQKTAKHESGLRTCETGGLTSMTTSNERTRTSLCWCNVPLPVQGRSASILKKRHRHVDGAVALTTKVSLEVSPIWKISPPPDLTGSPSKTLRFAISKQQRQPWMKPTREDVGIWQHLTTPLARRVLMTKKQNPTLGRA